MTKTLRSNRFEWQRSPGGAPDGVLSAPLARSTSSNGSFQVGSESARGRLFDSGNPFTSADVGRLVTFTADTPPTSGGVNHGSDLEIDWTYRIIQFIGAGEVELEGFRAQFAGSSISYTIHASATFVAASAVFPENTGPLGTDGDGEDRSNTGPVEWQSLFFPEAADLRLRLYPFVVSGRTNGTTLTVSDPFDNFPTFPTESALRWHLRDRPAVTYEQLYKITHQFFLHMGAEPHQHRGKNNGAGVGGDANNNVYIVHDWIYRLVGESADTVGFLRWMAYHRMDEPLVGTDTSANWGFDLAFFSAWDREFAPVTVAGGTDANPGNGVNALSAHNSTTVNNHFAAQCDTINTTSNHDVWFSTAVAQPGSAFGQDVAWGSPFHFSASGQSRRPNNLNTFEGGEVTDVNYYFFGSKDEFHIYYETPGFGSSYIGGGFLDPRSDAQSNKFVTNFSTPNGTNILLRIGGPGVSDGTDPTGTTPPHQIGDRIQSVGQTVNTPITPPSAHVGEFIDSSAITDLPGLIPARGILICDTQSNIADAALTTLNDGLANPNSSRVYEFDKNASFPDAGGDLIWDINAAVSADDVRDSVVAGINPTVTADFTWNGSTTITTGDTSEVLVDEWIGFLSDTPTELAAQLFRITAITPNVDITIDNPDGLAIPTGSGASASFRAVHAFRATGTISGRVDLFHGIQGGVGNIAIIDAGGEFLTGTEGMDGGGYAIEIQNLANPLDAGALVGEDPQPLFFFRPNENTTPFIAAPGSTQQGTFRVSNRADFDHSTYRDHNGPGTSPGGENSNGFDAVADLSGLAGPDTREINPNKRSGRMGLVTVHCRDTTGGQLRGSMKYCRFANPRVGMYVMKPDRNGDFHLLLPFTDRTTPAGGELNANELAMAFGPIPAAMASVS